MSLPKAVVTIDGGVVQSVDLNGEIAVEIRDYDNGDNDVSVFCEENDVDDVEDLTDEQLRELELAGTFQDGDDLGRFYTVELHTPEGTGVVGDDGTAAAERAA